MKTSPPPRFTPLPPDASGVVSWIHVGDLHMLGEDGQNFIDLSAIVEELERDFTGGASFVFLPGDNIDDGSVRSYETVRRALDRLSLPWCAIVGDHDVHERSYDNFRRFMSPDLRYAFAVDAVRFVAMNAFDQPRPDAFVVSDDQAGWLDGELANAEMTKVVLLHCYPSELKVNADWVGESIRSHGVRVVDMGHTHYNEVANDGEVVYTATRSTGQIEEGPVGYSVANLDGDAFSWRFYPLGEPLKAMIVSPGDGRLARDGDPVPSGEVEVRVRVWGARPVRSVQASSSERTVDLAPLRGANLWSGKLELGKNGEISAEAKDEAGKVATDSILTVRPAVRRHRRDLENALEAWAERGLLGTRLGPNANGRKW